MHRPPAVSFQAGRSRWHAAVLLGVGTIGWLSLFMLVLRPQPEFHTAALWGQSMVVLLSCAVAARAWHRSPTGTLQWDGQHWVWSAAHDVVVSRVRVVGDLQRCMLLVLQLPDQPRMWLWLDRAQTTPQAWRALRRALVHTTQQGPPSVGLGSEGGLP